MISNSYKSLDILWQQHLNNLHSNYNDHQQQQKTVYIVHGNNNPLRSNVLTITNNHPYRPKQTQLQQKKSFRLDLTYIKITITSLPMFAHNYKVGSSTTEVHMPVWNSSHQKWIWQITTAVGEFINKRKIVNNHSNSSKVNSVCQVYENYLMCSQVEISAGIFALPF